MNICIISPMKLPIPSEKGGAIETIIDQLIKQNEIEKKMYIDCYSIINGIGKSKTCLSEYTRIIYIKTHKFLEVTQNILNFYKIVTHKIFKIKLNKIDFVYKKISKLTKNKDYDYIIFEGGEYSCVRYFLKFYNKNKLVLHLHHTLESSIYAKYFGKIICVSRYVKEQLIIKSNIDPKRVYILKNVVDSNIFLNRISKFEKEKIRNFINFNSNDKILLFCGRIIKEKGIKELLLAFKSLRNKNVKLIVIGSSNFGNKITTKFEKEIISMIEDNKNIIYLGFIKNNEMFKYYQIADIFIMPANWEEAAGLVNLEAMLSGVPIITTRMGGIPEYLNNDQCIFIDNHHNFVENLKNAIDDLLDDDIKRQTLSNNCLRNLNEISLNKYYNEFFEILG